MMNTVHAFIGAFIFVGVVSRCSSDKMVNIHTFWMWLLTFGGLGIDLVVNCLEDTGIPPCFTVLHQVTYSSYDGCHEKGSLRSDLVSGIVQQGKWEAAIIITDDLPRLAMDRYQYLFVAHLSCDQPYNDVIGLLQDPPSFGDYHNVITDCNSSVIEPVISQLYIHRKKESISVNWLFVDLKVETFNKQTSYLKDGDNAVLLNKPSNNNQHISDLDLDPLSMKLHWCLTDCFKTGTLRYLGHFQNKHEILQMDVELLPSIFKQFYGRQLQIVHQIVPPYMYMSLKNGTTVLDGFEMEVIKTLAEKYNFSFKTFLSPDGAWGAKINDSWWNGMIGTVMRGEADMAACSISVQASREEVVDFLYSHWEDATVFSLRYDSNKWFYFMIIFTKESWIWVLTLPVIVSLVIFVIRIIRRTIFDSVDELRYPTCSEQSYKWYNCLLSTSANFTRAFKSLITACITGFHWLLHASIDTTDYPKTDKHPKRQMSWLEMLFILYGNLFLQGDTIPDKCFSVRWVIAGYWLTVISLTAAYMGHMTAALAVREVKLPFHNLRGLAEDTEYTIKIWDSSHVHIAFEEAKQGIYKDLWAKIQRSPDESIEPSHDVSLEHYLTTKYPEKVVRAVNKMEILEAMRRYGSCDGYVLDEEFLKGSLALTIKQGTPYRKHMDKTIMEMHESGLIGFWMKHHMSKDFCKHQKGAASEPVRFDDLTHVWLLILGTGLAASVIALIMELLTRYIRWLRLLL